MLWTLIGCGAGPWVEGEYQFYTLTVQDACLDGAMEIIFMPNGPASEHLFEYPVFVPHPKNTPDSYDIDLRAPFLGMPVTVETTDFGLGVRGSVMESVLLNESQYGDCVTTMSVDVDLYAIEEGLMTGDARLDVSNARGDEGRCPSFDADPCQVSLELRAQLQ